VTIPSSKQPQTAMPGAPIVSFFQSGETEENCGKRGSGRGCFFKAFIKLARKTPRTSFEGTGEGELDLYIKTVSGPLGVRNRPASYVQACNFLYIEALAGSWLEKGSQRKEGA